ncbi:unnamed protein product [Rhizophagus irregularis]|uniref:Uncharacterized protein n=1 Tax=Rhizophagus irregularis TaxID=588596 RepID=A0A916E3Z8_9GLOM|nr:unnamed protein product [Rhizophagus irregularis]
MKIDWTLRWIQQVYTLSFGEVVGNAYYHDDVKMNGDREKILKAMQLALFKIRQLFPEDHPNLKNLETCVQEGCIHALD